MKMIKEQPLFVSLQRNETDYLRLNSKKIADEPGLRIFPFAGAAGKQDPTRFRIADVMQNVEDARISDPRHFIKGVDHQGRAARPRAESTGSDAPGPDPISDAIQ
ncbi:hypothetical protein DYI42_01235 [Vannielia litorea]|nr:hypothetical protein [Vannielia litorea]